MSCDEKLDNICIKVPPKEAMTRIVRLATAALSSRVGLNLDQADDLNTAVEEVFRSIIVGHDQTDDLFCVCYRLGDDRLEVIMESVPLDLSDQSSSVNRYSRFVIESIIDDLTDMPNPDKGYDIHMVKYLAG